MSKHFEMEYFTDPLCCWSWGMEPQMRKLRYLLKNQLSYRYVMGGLIRDWDHYKDPLNSINRPSQMGPLWMEAKHTTGQPIDESIWIKGPVDTSYPACMAVKAAEMQSPMAGEAMLRWLREAVMMHRKNIGEKEVILEIAENLVDEGLLSMQKFERSFFSEESATAFRMDLNAVKLKGISRFPTMLISSGNKTVQITGYRPFSVLLDAFKALDPEFNLDENIDEETYISSWKSLTQREKKEIYLGDWSINSLK